MDENRILFADLDGTIIREDLSNLAFINYLKKIHLNYFIIYLFFCLEVNHI